MYLLGTTQNCDVKWAQQRSKFSRKFSSTWISLSEDSYSSRQKSSKFVILSQKRTASKHSKQVIHTEHDVIFWQPISLQWSMHSLPLTGTAALYRMCWTIIVVCGGSALTFSLAVVLPGMSGYMAVPPTWMYTAYTVVLNYSRLTYSSSLCTLLPSEAIPACWQHSLTEKLK